jgi:hypothetical protein
MSTESFLRPIELDEKQTEQLLDMIEEAEGIKTVFDHLGWLIQEKNDGTIIISYFDEQHFCGEIVLDIKDGLKVIRCN